MAAMILVENPGSRAAFHQLTHTAQGAPLTLTDFIFPAFLFAVGMSVFYAIGRNPVTGPDKARVLRKIGKRSLLLFLLGVLLYLFPSFQYAALQFHGVLQRIAIVFAACGILALYTGRRTQMILFYTILIGYWALLKWVPVPLNGMLQWPDMAHNPATELDRLVFGYPVPEGILSSLPAIATGLLGMLCASRLHTRSLFFNGCLFILAGLCWGVFFHPPQSGWSARIFFSIEKDLWTSSFVLYTGGACMVFFSIISKVVDEWKITRWTPPFLAFGLNSLLVYMLSHILGSLLRVTRVHQWMMEEIFNPLFTPAFASLCFSCIYLLFWYAVLWVLYKKKWFLKI